MEVVDLSPYRTAGSLVMSGRPKGAEVRKQLDIETKDNAPGQIEIVFPADVISVNRSFFLGLLGESVKHLGEAEFRKKYSFKCENAVVADIESGILAALETGNPLRPAR